MFKNNNKVINCFSQLATYEISSEYKSLKRLKKLSSECVKRGLRVGVDVISSPSLNAASFINLLAFRAIERYNANKKRNKRNRDANTDVNIECLKLAQNIVMDGYASEWLLNYLENTSNYEFCGEDLRLSYARQKMQLLSANGDYYDDSEW